MITTEQIEIQKTNELNSAYIEGEFQKLGVEPLRWAIVEVTDDKYVLSVSFEK